MVASLAALIAAALMIVAAAVYLGSRRQDELQAQGEQRAVAHAIQSLEKAIATNVRDYGWWTDAVRFLSLELNEAWADENIGPYIYKTFGYDVALVVTGDDRPRIGWVRGERATDAAAMVLGPSLSRLLAQARASHSGAEPVPTVTVLPGEGGLFVSAASPIVPQPGTTVSLPDGPPALLVFAKCLDEAFLDELAAEFGFRDPSFAPPGTTPPEYTHVSLAGPSGEVVREIVWEPWRPGRAQLAWLIPALLGSLAVFSLFTRIVLGSIRRSTVAIRTSEARFRDIAEASSDWIWETDAALRLTYLSEHFRRATGLSPQHALGQPLHAVLEPPDPEQRARQAAVIEAALPFRDVLCHLLHPNGGDMRSLRVAGKPVLGPDGSFQGYRGTATDITAEMTALREVRKQEREALESLAAAKAELERLNAELERRVEERTQERESALAQLFQAQKVDAVGQLTGGVAHDFNNLLMAVLTNLDLLRNRLAGDPKALRLIGGAIQAAERGATLTQRLLAFARRQDLQPRAVDLPELVQGLADLLQRSVGPLVCIRIEAPQDLPAARVDPHQLELALLNLAVNARDAMPTGGTLTIALARDTVGFAHPAGLAPGDYVRIDVIDVGVGMDATTLRRAVEPFFSTKGPGRGTGLGLSMVHGLAAQSGGTLQLTSRLGEGTTATLWLPVAEVGRIAAEEAASAEPIHASERSATILVVDDDALVRMGTVAMLDELGHSVMEADSGQEALELLRERTDIDLVITDYAMPGMTGAALAREVRELRPGLPVLLATGYAELPEGATLDLPRLGKPYRLAELAALLRELLPWTVDDPKVVSLARRRSGFG
ncbi:ATP-binding protein [Benzoatithermus flavus]|uniref:histidine kinase n=1 Tax=Benzoatithermus flavus TaxID=3108223 RepID=A0ABU8XT61_9PROT